MADIVTIMNGFCGAMSVFSSARYLLSSDPKFMWLALTYPLAGMIFDAMDGKVARWRNESSMLGQELDSLADSVSPFINPTAQIPADSNNRSRLASRLPSAPSASAYAPKPTPSF